MISVSTEQARCAAQEQAVFPLSFAQQGLWFLEQYEPRKGLYNLPMAWRVQGVFDSDIVERSLNEIVRRHAALRTTFAVVDGLPVQVVRPSLQVELAPIDLPSRGDAEAEMQRLIAEEAQRPFDLVHGPLMRAVLIRIGEDDCVFLLTLHHIVADGWSVGILMKELGKLYRAFAAGQASPLRELPMQYTDHVRRQHEYLQGAVLTRQVDYWKRYLQGIPPVLELPSDRPRPLMLTYDGHTVRFALARELVNAMHILSQRRGGTLFMSLAAAFNVLLHRYTGANDVCIGYPVAGRNQQELEGLIGMFVNTLAMRTRITPDQSFERVLEQVRDSVLDGHAYQDAPFETLVHELNIKRDPSHHPLVQVMIAFNGASELELPELTAHAMEVDVGIAKFDLTLRLVVQTGGDVRGAIEYNRNLFDESSIERMAGHYRALLEAVVRSPSARIDALPMLSPRERQQLLLWGAAKTNFESNKCVHQLFERCVIEEPEAIALVCGDQLVTYGELNSKANQLAHYLRTLAVEPDELVGVCLQRSAEMVIAILAILKAGAGYVPLDPENPKDRLTYLLQDTGARIVLTQAALRPKLQPHGTKLVDLDDWSSLGTHPDTNPQCETRPEQLAYCIYTSGSTGQPKGVLIEHRQVVRLMAATRSYFEFSRSDIWTLFHSFAFDFSVWELWGALSYGGRAVMVSSNVARSPGDFLALLVKEQVTVLNQTPSAFLQLVEAERTGQSVSSLRYVILGGEKLKPQALSSWFERHSDGEPRVINMYGITETTVHVTYKRLRSEDVSSSASVIGNALPDLSTYVLNAMNEPCPVGVQGEIFVGGAGLARGYLYRPELTVQRFVPDPFSSQANARLYRTGDLARWLPTGELEYLGRADDQVKIRGYRIELGEVEFALLKCSGVREAAVLDREDEARGVQLVAYVVVQALAEKPSVHDLRKQLQATLPGYMVPAQFVFLNALPLTQNGKIDRAALPLPETARPDADSTYVAPRNPTEKVLTDIWCEVLRVDCVGVHDDFFALGGHSILAAQLIARVRDRLGTDMPMRVIFQAPTPAKLADFLKLSN